MAEIATPGETFVRKIISDDRIVPDKRTKDASNNFKLVVFGVIICLLNMACAWVLIVSSNRFVMTGLVSDGASSATSEALKLAAAANPDRLIFLDRIVENDVNHRNIANKQTIVIVAMAASFSLVAIGFALFVMGVEAAYTISGNSPTASLVIQASSPGLACFILAVVVICFAITRQTEVTYTPIELSQNSDQGLSPEIAPLPTPLELTPKYSQKGAAQ
jgi:hypothetical protein